MSLVVIMGLLGFVVDFGWAYWRREACRTAAQSAASAAAIAVLDKTPPACTTPGITCQAATACAASPTSPPATNIDNGCLYAKQNGFVNAGRQSVTIEANSGAPPVPGVSPNYWVRVTISESLPQTFSAVLGQPLGRVTARSTTGVFAAPANACIYALSPTGTGFSVNGTITIDSGCGIYVDSNDPWSAMSGGGNSVVTASEIKVVGAYNANGGTTIKPIPTTGAAPTADPLFYVAQPNQYQDYPTSRCDSTGLTESSVIHMPADGYYVVCGGGFSMNSNKHLTLPAGTYIMNGGGIDWKNGTITSDGGVTFFLTGGFSSISINGNMNVTLNAPTSGNYRGILFFQDRDHPLASVNINGGSGLILNGALYFPDSDLKYSGGSTTTNTYTALIAKTITFIGDSFFTADLGGIHNGIGMPRLAILE